jgi:hypothetical protein
MENGLILTTRIYGGEDLISIMLKSFKLIKNSIKESTPLLFTVGKAAVMVI